MIINWLAKMARQFLSPQDSNLDELNVNFDFALSAEIMGLLYVQNGGSLDEEAVDETDLQDEASSIALPQFTLDEHELALA